MSKKLVMSTGFWVTSPLDILAWLVFFKQYSDLLNRQILRDEVKRAYDHLRRTSECGNAVALLCNWLIDEIVDAAKPGDLLYWKDATKQDLHIHMVVNPEHKVALTCAQLRALESAIADRSLCSSLHSEPQRQKWLERVQSIIRAQREASTHCRSFHSAFASLNISKAYAISSELVNTAYKKSVLMNHPDHGGDGSRIDSLKEARMLLLGMLKPVPERFSLVIERGYIG